MNIKSNFENKKDHLIAYHKAYYQKNIEKTRKSNKSAASLRK